MYLQTVRQQDPGHDGARFLKARGRVPIRLLVLLALCTIIVPANALDDQPPALPYILTNHRVHLQALGGLVLTSLYFIGHNVTALSSTLVGPCMGITSMLWLMMSNNAAIAPRLSWSVFGAWSILTLIYFIFQCHRVANQRLYILLTIAGASSCVCLIALVQQSSLQGGLVTVIPPCTSFAAYTMAYCFPDRQVRRLNLETSEC